MADAQVALNQHSSSHSITVKWEKRVDKELDGYEVKYREGEKGPWKSLPQTGIDDNCVTIENLKVDTEYYIKVFSVLDGDNSFYKEFKSKTLKEILPDFIETTENTIYNSTVKIYKVKRTEKRIEDNTLRELQMISECKPLHFSDGFLEEKTILVLGATGSGKTTLLDVIFNFVANVSFNKDYRLKMVDLTEVEEMQKSKTQAHSQTSGITCYRIPKTPGFRINFQLNMIDTPGFLDTRENFDKLIPRLVQKLFTNVVEYLHAVCLVLPRSSSRLTPGQKYVFNSILELFGNDIRHNIVPFITFHDGGDAKDVIETLEEAKIPFHETFCFNNSDIFAANQSETNWKTRSESLNSFFKLLESMQRQCLKTSAGVIASRESIKLSLANMQTEFRDLVQKIINLRNDQQAMEMYSARIYGPDEKNSKKQLESYLTIEEKCDSESCNCTTCKKTCHANCWVPSQRLKWTCEVIKEGTCIICKCKSENHKMEYCVYKLNFREVETSWKNVTEIKDSVTNAKTNLNKMIADVRKRIDELHKTALKPETRTIETFIDEMISQEEKGTLKGYKDRIDIFNKIKQNLGQKSDDNFLSALLQ